MRPLVRAASAYLLGCAAGALLSLSRPTLLFVVAACVAAAAAALSGRWQLRPAAVALLFGLAGALGGASAALRLEQGCAAVFADGAAVSAVGVLEALPTARGTAPLRIAAARTSRRDPGCTGVVRAKLPAQSREGAAADVAPVVAAGVAVRVAGRWWASAPASVWPAAAERRGTLIVDTIVTLAAAPPGARKPALRMRGAVQQRLRSLFGERAGMVEALVLARGEQIEPDVRGRFVESGLAHMLAISGTHVALIAGALLLLLRAVRLRPNTAAWSAAAGTIAYVAFIGAPHAAARAAVQVTLVIAARVLQRPADAYALLAAAALLVAGHDPLAPLEPGFQLSFAGILGIIAARRPLLERLPPRLPRWLRDGLATGMAASLAALPIAALHFGQLATIGILATLAAVPLLAVAVPGIGVTLLASTISAPIAGFLAGGVAVLLDALVLVADTAARVPGGHGYVTRPGVLAAVAAAGAAIIATAMLRERAAATNAAGRSAAASASQRARRLAATGAAAAVLLIAPTLAGGFGGGRLEIHAIDVGQGDAIAVRTPAGRWILVDAGPRSASYDAGRARVLPFLRDNGVRRLDALILTHSDADHIGGAAAVLEAVDVGLVIDPAVPAGKAQYIETIDAARHGSARWLAGRAGRELRFDDVVLDFLAPDTLLDDRTVANDFSVVFRLEFGAFAALFLGDAPVAVEDRIAASHDPRFATSLIKIGHHGSRTATGDSLLDRMRPNIALISVGRRNRYGHPDPTVLRRLQAHGIPVLRTDEHGTIRVRVDREGRFDVAAER